MKKSKFYDINTKKNEIKYPENIKEDGWVKSDDAWYYFVDGKPLTGVWTVDDLFRVFDEKGCLLIGPQVVETDFGTGFIDEDAVATFNKNLIESFLKNNEK